MGDGRTFTTDVLDQSDVLGHDGHAHGTRGHVSEASITVETAEDLKSLTFSKQQPAILEVKPSTATSCVVRRSWVRCTCWSHRHWSRATSE